MLLALVLTPVLPRVTLLALRQRGASVEESAHWCRRRIETATVTPRNAGDQLRSRFAVVTVIASWVRFPLGEDTATTVRSACTHATSMGTIRVTGPVRAGRLWSLTPYGSGVTASPSSSIAVLRVTSSDRVASLLTTTCSCWSSCRWWLRRCTQGGSRLWK